MKEVHFCPCVPCTQMHQCKLGTRAPQDTVLEKTPEWTEGGVLGSDTPSAEGFFLPPSARAPVKRTHTAMN